MKSADLVVIGGSAAGLQAAMAVSYTHLTLPTTPYV
jgi:thioredoxin reductase